MKLIFCSLFILLLSTQASCVEFQNFIKEGVEYTWDKKEEYVEALQVYLAAFRKLYTELGVVDCEEHFKTQMEHELDLVEKYPEEIHWLVAKKDGKMVGLGIVEMTFYPDVYVRQLSVIPEFQLQGIGKQITFALNQNDDLRRILILARHVNTYALNFYSHIGFQNSDFIHPEYSPERYQSMEWSFSKN